MKQMLNCLKNFDKWKFSDEYMISQLYTTQVSHLTFFSCLLTFFKTKIEIVFETLTELCIIFECFYVFIYFFKVIYLKKIVCKKQLLDPFFSWLFLYCFFNS